MTTHPEAAMTREQVLEEALRELRSYANSVWFDEATATDEEHELMSKTGKALASAQQEPEPSADAEEVARNAALDITQAIFGGARSPVTEKILPIIQAALRRYAGDGVTDAMVEAAYEQWINDREAVNFGVSCVDVLKAHLRRALEAADRAKSGEKGGAR